MTTNKPGTVTQQSLFGCTSCYEDVSYPADHLHVYNGECWCESCWEYATHEIADGRDWGKLEPFKPALQAECELLRQEVEALQGIQPEMPPMPPNGKGLPRYGVRWNGPTQPLSVPKDDGYWTPWHLAQAESEKLRKDAERYRFIRDAEELPMNLMRLEMIGDVMDSALDAAMQESNHDNH